MSVAWYMSVACGVLVVWRLHIRYRAIFHHAETGAKVCQADVSVDVQQDVVWFDVPRHTELLDEQL